MLRWTLLCVACVLLVPSQAFAQAHPCDTTPASITARNTDQPFLLGWCHDGKDQNGNTSGALTWRIYRNTAAIASPTVAKGATANAAGLFYYTHTRTETSAGTYVFEVSAVNGIGEGPRVPFASLLVSDPPAAPAAITRQRIAVP